MDQQVRDTAGQGVALRPVHLVVLGAAGTGKTTIGRALAERLGLPFGEGDDFHSEANRAKMAAGQALTDEDRWPWLDRLASELRAIEDSGGSAVLACSALKEDRWPWLRSLRDWMSARAAAGSSSVVACSALRTAYRDVLREADGDVFFIHLVLPEDVNLERLVSRQGHFMKPVMLGSQRATLEALGQGEVGIEAVNVGDPGQVVDDLAAVLLDRFGARLTA